MSTKQIWILVGLLVLAGVGYVSFFFWKNLRGIKPAITPANQDIAQIIEDQTRQEIVGNPNQIPFPLTLPEDFEISIFAENFSKPRVIKQDPSGILLVSDIEAGQIIALPDKNQDGQADSHQLVIDNLNQPHGIEFLAFDEGYKLYVATTDAVISYDYDEKNQNASNPVKIAALPSDDGHYTRAIQKTTVNGKSKLLVSVGSSCNVCQENDERRAAILVMNPDGSSQEVYAKGLRNSVFLANRNGTDEVWATENSRDLLGDNLPPDEINIIEGGGDYGWPLCYGNNVHDTSFDHNPTDPCAKGKTIAAHFDIQAHSAPLGLDFFPNDGDWPQDLVGDLLVAYHGSWNRSEPTGYKLVKFDLDEFGQETDRSDFVSGWLQPDGNSLGRPVDVLIERDGKIYITDDKQGVGLIYLLKYTGNQ